MPGLRPWSTYHFIRSEMAEDCASNVAAKSVRQESLRTIGTILAGTPDTDLACTMVCMRQLNLNVTREFDRDLRLLMQARGIPNKSDAVRTAVREAAERSAGAASFDFRSLLGMGLRSPLPRRRRRLTEDDLWS